MRSQQPPDLDIRSILECAFVARDEAPDLWKLWLEDTYLDDGWHSKPAKSWWHHASGLGGCDRAAIFKRAGVKPVEHSVESLVTFEVGHHVHLLIQFGLAVHPEYELLAHEIGGFHKGLRIAARCDALYRDKGGRVTILEVKTEKMGADKWRQREAQKAHRQTTANPTHMVQAKATSMVISVNRPELAPERGWIAYFDKNTGNIDQQPLDWEDLEEQVIERVHLRNGMWAQYEANGELPDVLDQFPNRGLCQDRGDGTERGLYCQFRESCILARIAENEGRVLPSVQP